MNVILKPPPTFRMNEFRLRKAAIARSFDKAAPAYDAHAVVQRRVANHLARRIAELPLPEAPRILEIGCGTGFLGKSLLRRLSGAEILCTDLSPAMTRRCRAKIGGARGSFAVMDGELAAVAPVFDLVASSFAFQWFLDLRAALSGLASLLHPGGRLVFATLGADSLAEWRALQQESSGVFSGLAFPAAAGLREIAESTGRLRGRVEEEKIHLRYGDAAAFLHELKSLGAGTPGPGAAPGVARLRRLLRGAGKSGFSVTYHILYGSFAISGAARTGA